MDIEVTYIEDYINEWTFYSFNGKNEGHILRWVEVSSWKKSNSEVDSLIQKHCYMVWRLLGYNCTESVAS